MTNLSLTKETGRQSLTRDLRFFSFDHSVRRTHNEFAGRIEPTQNFVPTENGDDGDGHGTHVAGTAAGSTYGVARGATVVPVKVLDSNGSGDYAWIIAAIDSVTQQHQQNPGQRSVMNLSLGGPQFQALDTAVEAAMSAGVVAIVAAGNESKCNAR